MCLIAERAKEMINVPKGFLPHLSAVPAWSSSSLPLPSTPGSLTAPSLFIQLHSLPQTVQRLQITLQGLSREQNHHKPIHTEKRGKGNSPVLFP